MVITAEENITIVAVALVSQLTGKLPIIISRSVPRPMAVTKASTSTPKGSNFFSMARKAPDTAKEIVPRISMIYKKWVGMAR